MNPGFNPHLNIPGSVTHHPTHPSTDDNEGRNRVHTQHAHHHNPFAPGLWSASLWQERPMLPPRYPTIADNGTVIGIPTYTARPGTVIGIPTYPAYLGTSQGFPIVGGRMQPFPVAPTISAAVAYTNRINGGEGVLLPSVRKFRDSQLFSEVQKKGIQEYYRKYSMSIGMAHQLESLVGCRFEFILDDHKSTPDHRFESMKEEIWKRIELLRHIPNAGIVIRRASDFQSTKFEMNEENSEVVLNNIKDFLRSHKQSSCTQPFVEVYEAAVSDAVRENVKTIPYVFSARDLAKKRKSFFKKLTDTDPNKIARFAKELTKVVVNRPEEMVPTAFYPNSDNPDSNEIVNKLDTVAKKVGVIRPFEVEDKEVQSQQSKFFPFGEGYYIQASLLCPVNEFWDEVDEGRIFGKAELEDLLGTPIEEGTYNAYFNKVLDRQAEKYTESMKKEAMSKAKENSRNQDSSLMGSIELVTSINSEKFANNTNSEKIHEVPSLAKRIEDFRKSPDWTQEVENGINRLCMENRIPIGMGLHMTQVVGRHHEFNIDDSGSMGDFAHGRSGPSRMDKLKTLLKKAGKFLSYLPTKGVTISSLHSQKAYTIPDKTVSGAFDPVKFIDKFENTINKITVGGGTPLNRAAKAIYDRANRRSEITNTIFFTDGEPSDNSESFDTSYYPPRDSSAREIVGRQPIREFIKLLANRDAKKIPVTIAQATDDKAALAWTNLCDNVCKNVNSIDDKDNEIKQVRDHHGQSFPYDENIYIMSLLLGNDNKLFDGLDEDGIFSKAALEELYGRRMTDEEYDSYYNEAYALQCAPGTEKLQVKSISKYNDWSRAASSSQTGTPGSSSGNVWRSQLMSALPGPSGEGAYLPGRDTGEGSGSRAAADQEGAPKKSLTRLNAMRRTD